MSFVLLLLSPGGCVWISEEDWADRTAVYQEGCEESVWWLDADGDGFGGEDGVLDCQQPAGFVEAFGDCDDQDASVNPAASEVCDEKNNDCDARVDEDAPGAREWYLDGDGDGYGLRSRSVESCSTLPGYASLAGDCDDDDRAVNPEALEVCDGVDNDCDGSVDLAAVDRGTWYEDGDGDGYGDEDEPVSACTQPAGTAAGEADGVPFDCDDANSRIHPAAEDTCGDGLDNDCDGAIGADCVDAGDRALADLEALRWSGAGDGAGAAVAGVGNIDGEEGGELLVAAPDADRAWLVSGPGGGDLAGAAASLFGPEGSGAGASAAGVGDLDRDGYGELLIGGPSADGGAAWLLSGPLSGEIDLGEAVSFSGGSGRLGIAVAGGGDLSGDLLVDLAVADDRAESLAGAAYVFYGPVTASADIADADAVLTGAQPGDRAGRSLQGVGDISGDGVADALVGAPGFDGERGAALLVFGPVSGVMSLADADATLSGVEARDSAGGAVAAAGDLDGDGAADLLVGGAGADAIYLVAGPVTGDLALAEARAVLDGGGDAGLGAALTSVDFDGDGLWDLFAGAASDAAGGEDAGAVYGFYGPVSGGLALSDAHVRWLGAAGERAGESIARTGDVDRDGRGELLIGAPGVDDEAGAAWLIGASGL